MHNKVSTLLKSARIIPNGVCYTDSMAEGGHSNPEHISDQNKGDLREIVAALGIEGLSDDQLGQIEQILTANPQLSSEKAARAALDLLPSGEELPQEFTIKEAELLAQEMGVPVKREELVDYLKVIQQDLAQGLHPGASARDLLKGVLESLFQK